MEERRRLAEKVVDPSFLEGMSSMTLDQIREMRDEARDAETEVSFERRLCQARIDILAAELKRRSGETEGDLISRLPEILATEAATPGTSPLPDRAPDFSLPRNVDIPRRRVEEIMGEQTLARLPQVPTEEIDGIIDALAEHERNLSARRRELHDVMDRIQSQFISAIRASHTSSMAPDS
ncbi:MAG: hypothetical protein M3345_06885 [Actinomycetota bacterium]|nr:hypothetical protein [Actinomycetota bacterium]